MDLVIMQMEFMNNSCSAERSWLPKPCWVAVTGDQ